MPQVPVQEVLDLLEKHSDQRFPDEPFTVLEHSLRTAFFAEEEKAPSTEIAAALLHNIGLLLPRAAKEPSGQSEDLRPEEVARAYLRRWFADPVLQPILLQDAAKRYLAVTEPGYAELLPASSKALAGEDGPIISTAEAEAFIKAPYAETALRLRRRHDRALHEEIEVPQLDSYVPHLDASSIELDNLSPAQII